jgi:hypothetical protein
MKICPALVSPRVRQKYADLHLDQVTSPAKMSAGYLSTSPAKGSAGYLHVGPLNHHQKISSNKKLSAVYTKEESD